MELVVGTRYLSHTARLGALLLGLWLGQAAAAGPAACSQAQWPLWERFAQRFIQADGRVIDFSVAEQHSTSEGQSYAMFFALIARDQERFDRLWAWSLKNLADGDGKRLPAWQWGKRKNGSWGVLDPNPASDANLWFAYSLLEAGRLWKVKRYTDQAHGLLNLVASQEVADVPGLGPTLLPAAKGFVLEERVWRLNPSYVPVPLLRAFEREQPKGPWSKVLASFAQMLEQGTPKGFAPDWLGYEKPKSPQDRGMFMVDPVKGDLGSYDAIRNYLWAGMTAPSDKLAALLKRRLSGMEKVLEIADLPPEKVHTSIGVTEGMGPVGFSAALLPYLSSRKAGASLQTQQSRVQARLIDAAANPAPVYYDQVLGLFGTGWMEQRYQFLPTGRLQLRWEKACPANPATVR
ncbi:cellulose synthase complex periplasmic endoglucanase BcsZ [Comamonas composti]|uniref:cellulose synthase complex periplasmic endoglucanase BcsZ n=1 Tax=Comamonas composti TaxID=408558 RepID=UPI0003F575D6|nr:cellulose synthase complex periplasmic endoglucanase BcsZ [Comamonas composti]